MYGEDGEMEMRGGGGGAGGVHGVGGDVVRGEMEGATSRGIGVVHMRGGVVVISMGTAAPNKCTMRG